MKNNVALEQNLLSIFVFLYGILLWPFENAATIFVVPRLIILGLFIAILPVVRMASQKDARLLDLPKALLGQPRYVFFLLAFIASVVPSVLLSPDPGHAWFGSQNFQTGGMFIILASLTFWIYSTGPKVPRFGLISLIIVLNIITIVEYLGFRPLDFVTSVFHPLSTSFPAATVSHRGQLAGLLLLLAILPLYWFKGDYTNWKFFALFALAVAGLGCTTNSTALIALAVTICILIFTQFKLLRWKSLIILIIAILSYNSYQYLKPVNNYFQNIGWVRVKSESKDAENTITFSTRLLLWEAATRMTLARPVFGWGPQTYNQYWFTYLPKAKADQLFRLELGLKPGQKMVRMNDSAAYKLPNGKTQPVVLNYLSSHSGYLDLAYGQGLVGILLFLALAISVLIHLYKLSGNFFIYAFLPVLAYGVYLAAWFITVPVTGIAVIVFGMIVNNATPKTCIIEHKSSISLSEIPVSKRIL
ncbi:O-antigen ligase family protein [Deinococcus psychrotolerans]|nr:O-antigen ligase family protein [Deinococcus psychrotolerans]